MIAYINSKTITLKGCKPRKVGNNRSVTLIVWEEIIEPYTICEDPSSNNIGAVPTVGFASSHAGNLLQIKVISMLYSQVTLHV